MLRFAEEIILILLDDEDGRFVRVPRSSLNFALAGGVLMDLAMENRIDTDLKNLMLIDPTPVGDSLLDPFLAEIAASPQKDTRYWLEHIAESAPQIREDALARLVDRGSWSGRTTSSCGCSAPGATPPSTARPSAR